MKLIIDNRETSFIERLNHLFPPLTHQISYEVDRLDVGDMIIRSENDDDIVIFERKTTYDLAASIKDGRYNEQSFRLDSSNVHNHNIFYLIEGDIERLYEYKARTSKSVLYSCITSLSFYKGFSVYNTKSLDETCKFVYNFISKLKKEHFKRKLPFYSNLSASDDVIYREEDKTDSCIQDMGKDDDPCEKEEKEAVPTKDDDAKMMMDIGGGSIAEVDQDKDKEDTGVFIIPNNQLSTSSITIDSKYIYQTPKPRYSEIIKKEKKANITLDNIAEIMLCAIPGVGSQCAYSIMNQYNGSLHDMLNHLSEDPTALDKIKIVNSNGQNRKISKSSVENIKRFMLKNNIG